MSAPLDKAIILAGGEGKRLWPWTSAERPKPLLPLGGNGRTLLGATLDRLAGVVDPESIVLQAEAHLGARLLDGETRLGATQLQTEPSARDTGPAVTIAMLRAWQQKPDSVVALLPADHRVLDADRFRSALRRAAEEARLGALVVLGIVPREPSSAFGYVEAIQTQGDLRDVRRFVEKPNEATAREFVASGRHFWNAGIFVWRADRFREELSRVAPEMLGAVERFLAGSYGSWSEAPKMSIDYALMEQAEGVRMVPLDAGWDDVGGWEAVGRMAAASDAGPATLCDLRGPGAEGSLAISLLETASPVLLMEPGPWLHVHGSSGTLLARRGSDAALKRFV
ncbi:MAG: mannose-1-phosphate guanylyltransferase [Acidobacteriota bacterium]